MNNDRLTRLAFLIVICLLFGMLLFTFFTLVAEGSEPPVDGVRINEVGWSGTEASHYDEWFEIHNSTSSTLDTSGWRIELAREDGDGVVYTTTIELPESQIQPDQYALYERTDDTATSEEANGVYSGGLPNTTVIAMSLVRDNGTVLHSVEFPDGWPAGSNSPRASMSLLADWSGWYTSLQPYSNSTDVDGNPILGSPGHPNPAPGQAEGCFNNWPQHVEVPEFDFVSGNPVGNGPEVEPVLRWDADLLTSENEVVSVWVIAYWDFDLDEWYIPEYDVSAYTEATEQCQQAFDAHVWGLLDAINEGVGEDVPQDALRAWLLAMNDWNNAIAQSGEGQYGAVLPIVRSE